MAIMRWLPGRELDRFRREIDRMFDESLAKRDFRHCLVLRRVLCSQRWMCMTKMTRL